jgi:hypothetical protein
VVLPITLPSWLENRVGLSCGVQVTKCDMAGSDEDYGRSRRPGADHWGWLRICWVLGGWMIKRSGDAVCGLHRAQGDKECRFLGLASKPLGRLSWFGLKTRVNGLSMVWLQNH